MLVVMVVVFSESDIGGTDDNFGTIDIPCHDGFYGASDICSYSGSSIGGTGVGYCDSCIICVGYCCRIGVFLFYSRIVLNIIVVMLLQKWCVGEGYGSRTTCGGSDDYGGSDNSTHYAGYSYSTITGAIGK